MKRLLTGVLIIGMAFGLSGCLGSKAVTTIVQEGDKMTTTLTGAAVQRDIVYADERKHRDTQTEKMYKQSGVKMEMEMYTFTSPDGKFTFTTNRVKTVTAKAPNRYQQNIETRPPDHRGWDSLDKGLGVLGKGVIGYFLNDAFQTGSQANGTRYYGDFNPQTAEPYIIEPSYAPIQ
jgi:hypothetical protein